MKVSAIIMCMFLFGFVLLWAGCEQTSALPESSSEPGDGLRTSVYAPYAPAKIDVMPLTEIITPDSSQEDAKISVYVSLLDSFGCQIKSPGIFRFELYEHVQRSAEPKGKRAVIWLDINLTNAAKNNKHWRDFLRAYQFNLPCEPRSKQGYILQVTCMCPSGRRLSAEFTLKHAK